MGNKIDLDHNRADPDRSRRGVTCCRAMGSDLYVYMYNDKPGVYLTEQGTPVSEVFAKQAGFDTVRYAKARAKAENMAKAEAVIKAELNIISDDEDPDDMHIVARKDGWSVQEIAGGRAHIRDPFNNIVTPAPLPVDVAKAMMLRMVPDSPEPTLFVADEAPKAHMKPLKET